MCTSSLATLVSGATSAASAVSGSGAPYAFGAASAAPAASSAFGGGGLSTALSIASMGLKSFSAMSAAGNTATAYDAQADAAATNALIAERAAASAYTTGSDQAANIEQRGAQTKASQTAAMAANGIDVTPGASGTADNVRASTDYATTQDVNTTLANAARAAAGYTQQSTNYANQAGALRAAASRNSEAAAGVSSLITGATSVASNWYRNQRAGVS